jgi:hypothetical protein
MARYNPNRVPDSKRTPQAKARTRNLRAARKLKRDRNSWNGPAK